MYGLDIADKEVPYIPYEDKEGTLDVVFCSDNDYFRKAEFRLGYACYKAIDERSEGFGTRVDHANKRDYSIFELAAVSEISKIEIIFYEGQARQYDIKIEVAQDGAHVQGSQNLVKWQTVFSGKTPNVGGTKENPDPVVIKFNAPVEGQFIRIIGNGNYLDGSNTLNGDHTAYRDIQIFGTKTDEVYTYQNTVFGASATNASATNASATNASATNASATNASATNASATNASATNAFADDPFKNIGDIDDDNFPIGFVDKITVFRYAQIE